MSNSPKNQFASGPPSGGSDGIQAAFGGKYPGMIYHPDGSHTIVHSAAEELDHAEWARTPFAQPEPVKPMDPMATIKADIENLRQDMAFLQAKYEELMGIVTAPPKGKSK